MGIAWATGDIYLPKPKRRQPEYSMHAALVTQIRARAHPDVVWWHTPNGGKRNVREAVRFKRLGVRAGVSDLVFLHRNHFYALELKADGRPTTAQMQFVSDVNEAGGHACICDDYDRALRTLEIWGLIR